MICEGPLERGGVRRVPVEIACRDPSELRRRVSPEEVSPAGNRVHGLFLHGLNFRGSGRRSNDSAAVTQENWRQFPWSHTIAGGYVSKRLTGRGT